MSLSYGDGDLAGSVASLSVSASASTVGTPVQPSEYLRRRVFFLIDRTACKNEEDPPQDMILYFYPPEVRHGRRGRGAEERGPTETRRSPRTREGGQARDGEGRSCRWTCSCF